MNYRKTKFSINLKKAQINFKKMTESLNRTIFLTGFMGSGKTMIGRQLAQMLHRSFYDLDEIICAAHNMTVKEIFEKFGEPFFRLTETQELRALVNQEILSVVALGGGAYCSEQNQSLLKNNGIVLFLDVKTNLLIQRLMKNTKRPLLLNSDGSMKTEVEVAAIIEDMMEKRQNWYLNADVHLYIDQAMDKDEVSSFVYQELKKKLT